MVTDAHVWTAGRSETLQYLDETPRRDELTTSPSHPSAIRRLAIACACAVFAVVLLAAQAAQAGGAPLRYVALGDSYSAASGVLPLDLSAPQCLRSTRNYPHVIAGATGAQLKDVTCGAADTSDFFDPQYPGVAPQLDAVADGHPARHHDDRRQRQRRLHQLDPRPAARPGC